MKNQSFYSFKMAKKRYKKCCDCNNKAVWYYMPSGEGKNHYCNDCVPRGCGCNLHDIEKDGLPRENTNVMWWSKKTYDETWAKSDISVKLEDFGTYEKMEDSFYYEYLDDNKRRQCCCEFWYDDDDIIEERHYIIRKSDINHVLETSKQKYSISESLRNSIIDFCKILKPEGDYNVFMSRFYEICKPYMKIGYNAKMNRHFYLSIQYKLRELRIKKLFEWEK